ncbi:hypothetical protein SAMN02910435_02570, partial [Ruminococcaceae bacterium D5]
VSSLGYDLCQIEPYYNYDEDRWAEFMVWLRAPSCLQTARGKIRP